MKISFIEPHLGIYGGIRRIIELSNRLVGKGHDVTIYHSDGSPCRWLRSLAKTAPAEGALKEEHDILLFNDPSRANYALVRDAPAKLKVLYVLELYEKELLPGFKFRRYFPWHLRMRILKDYLLFSDLILVNATWEQVWLKAHLGIESKKVLGGVDFDMFRPLSTKRAQNEFRILCSGDPRKRKGFDTIQAAFAKARAVYPNMILETYHGKGIPQGQMAEIYNAADLFIEASTQAGWNNPVAEAMACKVPVLCSDIGGVADFAFHEQTALLFPPGDVDALTHALLRLLRDESLRQRLVDQAFERINIFPWDECANRLEHVLWKALLKKGER